MESALYGMAVLETDNQNRQMAVGTRVGRRRATTGMIAMGSWRWNTHNIGHTIGCVEAGRMVHLLKVRVDRLNTLPLLRQMTTDTDLVWRTWLLRLDSNDQGGDEDRPAEDGLDLLQGERTIHAARGDFLEDVVVDLGGMHEAAGVVGEDHRLLQRRHTTKREAFT